MSDSVEVLEASRNKSAIQSAIQTWLNNNTVTSVDFISIDRRGSNKMLITIVYTA